MTSTQYLAAFSALSQDSKGGGLPVRIQNERDVLHFSVGQLLLERNAEFLEAFTRSGDVWHGNRNVPVALAGITVS